MSREEGTTESWRCAYRSCFAALDDAFRKYAYPLPLVDQRRNLPPDDAVDRR